MKDKNSEKHTRISINFY